MQPIRMMSRALPWMFVGFAVFAAVVRLTVQDSIQRLSPLFYSTPPQVITVIAMFSAALWFLQGRRRAAALAGLAGIGCAVWAAEATWFDRSEVETPHNARIMVWNVASGALGWSGIDKTIRELNAEVVGFVEAGSNTDRSLSAWQREFPDYTFSDDGYGLLLMARGPVSNISRGRLGSRGLFLRATVRLGTADVDVVVVDIGSNPFKSRHEPMEELAKLVDASSDRPLFVMGDFNTPIDSVHFAPLRSRLVNAFETAGDGYSPTWPVPAPVIQIDHIWTDGQMPLVRCEAGWTWNSDHRPVCVDVSLDQG